MSRPWDVSDIGLTTIFAGALSGFVANKFFYGATSQGSARAAVEFADEVILAFLQQPTPPDDGALASTKGERVLTPENGADQ